MGTKSLGILLVVAVIAGTATAPAAAAQGDAQSGGSSSGIFTKQNIGRAVGGALGALLGSQVGGGKGKLATTVVGALAGFWIGGEIGQRLDASDQQGIARTTQTALDTGKSQTWTNPDTGVKTRVSVDDTRVERTPVESQGLKPKVSETPPLELVNAFYVAQAKCNVRGGPGTDYDVMTVLSKGQRIAVVGKVQGADWYMVSDDGLGTGFVYAPLLSRAEDQPTKVSALRMAARDAEKTGSADERKCRLVTQEVSLADGTRKTHQLTACQQPDGSWVQSS